MDFTTSEIQRHSAWNLHLKRVPNSAEVHELIPLLALINEPPLLSDQVDDCRSWSLSVDGAFSVKSLYTALSSKEKPLSSNSFPNRLVWNSSLPAKFNFHLWLIALNKVLTVENLNKRGFQFVNRCYLCEAASENPAHLFLHCPFTWSIWCSLLPKEDWFWAYPRDLQQLLFSWKHYCKGKSILRKKILLFLPSAICWCIWKERNSRIFNNFSTTIHNVSIEIKSLLARWFRVYFPEFSIDLIQWIFNWDAVIDPH